jgi:hypothetical protein
MMNPKDTVLVNLKESKGRLSKPTALKPRVSLLNSIPYRIPHTEMSSWNLH